MKNNNNNIDYRKDLCSISLDLDNHWSYLKIHGDNAWREYPSYLDTFIPYIMKVLNDQNLKITFFIVGKDAELKRNSEFLNMISAAGHDIANHSFNHESWLHLYSKDELRNEVLKAEECIEKVTGVKTTGFRGPGFSWSNKLFEVLSENNYLYDASILPTFIGPLARLYYFKTANLSKEEREKRRELFGKFADGFRPVKSYYWKMKSKGNILEIPVSTIPFFKTPFHLSYLVYLNNISPSLMRIYLDTAIQMCKLTKTEPSFLLHPLDLIGGDEINELAFFPGMNVRSPDKIKLFNEIINKLKSSFNLVSMDFYAKEFFSRNVEVKYKEII